MLAAGWCWLLAAARLDCSAAEGEVTEADDPQGDVEEEEDTYESTGMFALCLMSAVSAVSFTCGRWTRRASPAAEQELRGRVREALHTERSSGSSAGFASVPESEEEQSPRAAATGAGAPEAEPQSVSSSSQARTSSGTQSRTSSSAQASSSSSTRARSSVAGPEPEGEPSANAGSANASAPGGAEPTRRPFARPTPTRTWTAPRTPTAPPPAARAGPPFNPLSGGAWTGRHRVQLDRMRRDVERVPCPHCRVRTATHASVCNQFTFRVKCAECGLLRDKQNVRG